MGVRLVSTQWSLATLTVVPRYTVASQEAQSNLLILLADATAKLESGTVIVLVAFTMGHSLPKCHDLMASI